MSSSETDLIRSCRKRKQAGDGGDGSISKRRRVSSLQRAKQNQIEAQRGQPSAVEDTTTFMHPGWFRMKTQCIQWSIDWLIFTAQYKAKYLELHPLGRGGCGCVFAGYNKSSHSPVSAHSDLFTCVHAEFNQDVLKDTCMLQVAIKHVSKEKVLCKSKVSPTGVQRVCVCVWSPPDARRAYYMCSIVVCLFHQLFSIVFYFRPKMGNKCRLKLPSCWKFQREKEKWLCQHQLDSWTGTIWTRSSYWWWRDRYHLKTWWSTARTMEGP